MVLPNGQRTPLHDAREGLSVTEIGDNEEKCLYLFLNSPLFLSFSFFQLIFIQKLLALYFLKIRKSES
jgi:hypothetical protein